MGWLAKLLLKISGWKTVLAYVLAQIPWFNDFPTLKDAIMDVVANPQDPTKWGNLIIQVLFAVGILHRVVKNMRGE